MTITVTGELQTAREALVKNYQVVCGDAKLLCDTSKRPRNRGLRRRRTDVSENERKSARTRGLADTKTPVKRKREKGTGTRLSSVILAEQDLNSPERVKRARVSTKSEKTGPWRDTAEKGAAIPKNGSNLPSIDAFKRRPIIRQDGNLERLILKCKKEKLTLLLPDDEEYIVEKIREHRMVGERMEVLIRWKDWSAAHDTWEPADSVTVAANLQIMEYFAAKKMRSECFVFFVKFCKGHLLHKDVVDYLLLAKLARSELRMEGDRVMKPNGTELKELQSALRKILEKGDAKGVLKKFNGEWKRLIKFIRDRLEVLDDNERWSRVMADKEPNADIDIENIADLETIPKTFQYVTDYVVSPKVEILAPTKYCACEKDGCFKSNCCGMHKNRQELEVRAYNANGQLTNSCTSLPIFECNSRCKCGEACGNRVIQRGVTHAMTIFKTMNRGWGVRTTNKIAKGAFVAEYLGELMTSEEAVGRHAINFAYLFDLKPYRDKSCENTVDAAVYGNISRFFNHSCDPNMAISYAYIENQNLAAPRLAFFARRPIAPDEELTFNYCMQTTKGEGELERVMCMCGSHRCRKYLF